MFDHNHYVPVIKWKRGERSALKTLNDGIKKRMTPLLEIQPVPFNHEAGDFSKTLDEHLVNIGTQAKECLPMGFPSFVDVWTLYDNEDFDDTTVLQSGVHPVEFVMASLEKNGIPAIPVTGLARNRPFHDAIKSILTRYNRGVCVRITREDLLDMETMKTTLKALRNFLEIEKDQIDIVLDYKQISGTTVGRLQTELITLLAQFPSLGKWRTVTFVGTSMTVNLSQFPTDSTGVISRIEWLAYSSLRQLNLPRIPTYGDYNISHPEYLNIDPRVMNIGASIRYTTDSEFFIVKGKRIKGNGFSQMNDICKVVVSHPKYQGPSFSYGDFYIDECAQKKVSPGTKETWVTVGVNHHLTQVLSNLSNLADS